jgi:hypothetical protein
MHCSEQDLAASAPRAPFDRSVLAANISRPARHSA